MALTNKLSAIGNAIREKTGKTGLMTLDEMPAQIASITTGSGGGGEMEPIVLTTDTNYACAGKVASAYIKNYGNTISTNDLSNTSYMFYKYENESIPFDININVSTSRAMNNMFNYCSNLKELPKIEKAYPNTLASIFQDCHSLRYIPDDYFNTWNFNAINNNAYAQTGGIFSYCYSLRKVPTHFLKNIAGNQTSSYYFGYGFGSCVALDEVIGLGVHKATMTSNIYGSLFSYSGYRIKHFTFDTNEDGTPKTANLKSQTIDLSNNIGCYLYAGGDNTSAWDESTRNAGIESSNITKYNSGITNDKLIYNAETYEALKNDEDAFCIMSKSDGPKYSRYTRASAVETINSLPDTSAYLATAGGTNTIKFKGVSGEWTDEGAINTMTEEEIAVATVKGWTVSFV